MAHGGNAVLGGLGCDVVDAVPHKVEAGRLQEHHVNADMVVVGGLHGDVRGGAADIVELRIARPHDQQVDVGVFPVIAPGAGTEEQPADHGTCRAVGPRSIPGAGCNQSVLVAPISPRADSRPRSRSTDRSRP